MGEPVKSWIMSQNIVHLFKMTTRDVYATLGTCQKNVFLRVKNRVKMNLKRSRKNRKNKKKRAKLKKMRKKSRRMNRKRKNKKMRTNLKRNKSKRSKKRKKRKKKRNKKRNKRRVKKNLIPFRLFTKCSKRFGKLKTIAKMSNHTQLSKLMPI